MKEKRMCQNCKNIFIIEDEDFDFYKKIDVPPPTWCPECRMMRRMVWRNERGLYKRNCDLCKRSIISIYGNDVKFPVYCKECWWSEKWNPMDYARDYNFLKPFFEQLKELQNEIPRVSLNEVFNTNCSYLNNAWHSNNCSMSFDLGYGENVVHCNACHFIKDSIDCSYSKKLELCNECIESKECSSSDFLENCEQCLDSYFLRSCKNCFSCILCSNMRGKRYCILNKQYSKEEFEREKERYVDGGFQKREHSKSLFKDLLFGTIRRENNNIHSVDCTGNNIWNSKNCKNSFNVFRSEDCKFANDIDSDMKNSMDITNATEGELLYEVLSVTGNNIKFSHWIVGLVDIEYSNLCAEGNSHIFGCVGLRGKEYCILNKQHTKEEYEALLPKIKQHMKDMPYIDTKGRRYTYGEFFPFELVPYAYNDTKAYEYFPLTKEGAITEGFRWREKEERNYKITKKSEELPDMIDNVLEDITSEIIECACGGKCGHNCSTAFRITPQELSFYKKMKLPLPRTCSTCRYRERFLRRNPLKLWKRQCQCVGERSENGEYVNIAKHQHEGRCSNKFETSYSPDRSEIVYCEQCYQSEIL